MSAEPSTLSRTEGQLADRLRRQYDRAAFMAALCIYVRIVSPELFEPLTGNVVGGTGLFVMPAYARWRRRSEQRRRHPHPPACSPAE
jgi:hypothetical protein